MPTATPMPRTLDAWLQQLGQLCLPIEQEQHTRLRRTLTDGRKTWRDIAQQIEHCPTFALQVLREANQSSNSLNEPADSLEIALARLGLQRCEALLAKTPALAEADIPLALRQILLISQHASQQARGLFGSRLARLWNELHGCSLLFLAPLWPLLSQYPQLFETWEQRVLVKGEAPGKVEREILGVPLIQLCLKLAERWRLPEWIVRGYQLLARDRRELVKALHIARDNEHPLHQQQMLDADIPLRHWLTHPSNCVLLANGLAVSAHHAWSTDHCLRWQRLIGLYLQLPLDAVQQEVHQHAVSSAQAIHDPTLWHPAQALLWPWSARRLKPAKAVERSSPPPALETWRQHCKRLLSEPSDFANVLQLTACARDALNDCGMLRVLVLLADRQHSRLQSQQMAGLDKAALALNLDPSNSQILRRLLAQPGQLRLSPENAAQYSALLPGSLKALFPGEHLLLRSITNNGRVVMLLVADQDGRAFNDISLQAFAKTAQCIERALHNFAKRPR
ncbi:HDOD domain-containing protein [Pseudomonas sp. 8Z]|uniref:HDOD domain-containing protein n=1 Tax=Pseudomonas sp. 8Z TaxID=2653166 RepID=UPI0012F07D3A|nr:HDOD domain-containing protein [Pseudomonas sp. 8Z]VXC15956.1 HDOD domain-containing protein [Pseudomonas sp. 8Z]